MRWSGLLVLVFLLGSGFALAPGDDSAGAQTHHMATVVEPRPYVVVATFDTGINPYHPMWRIGDGSDPTQSLPGFPNDTIRVRLHLSDDPATDRARSAQEWQKVLDQDGRPIVFEGTRIVAARADPGDPRPLFDAVERDHYHGARASSQIASAKYGMGDHAYVVPMDLDGGRSTYHGFIAAQMRWVLEQPWIDIIHVNIGIPAPWVYDYGNKRMLGQAVEQGKLVVIAAGNGAGNGGTPFPMEVADNAAVPGTLVAGAVDQCAAGAYYSNLNPHVVMDGVRTLAAHEVEYGSASFGGTSSASPRTTGYAAELLYKIRAHYGVTRGLADGALVVLPDDVTPPARGPLADGRLTAAELHELIRKTAEWPHDSRLDGGAFLQPCPRILDPRHTSLYAKYGYGEVSEHTIWNALDVALGSSPMPERPDADRWYALSESTRELLG